MPFQKGKPRAPKAGRKKGTPNKVTFHALASVQEVLEGRGINLPDKILEICESGKLKPAEKAKIMLKLQDFISPRHYVHSGPGGGPIALTATVAAEPMEKLLKNPDTFEAAKALAKKLNGNPEEPDSNAK